MEIVLFLWLAGIIDNVSNSLMVLTTISVIGLFISFPIADINYRNGMSGWIKNKWFYTWIALTAIVSLVNAIIPSKNTLYLMAGGYYGQKALQSETAGKVLTIINGRLDEMIKEIQK